MTSWHLEALATAAPVPYWLDRAQAPEAAARLVGAQDADLLIIGAGFTGLWAAIQALEDDPSRDVAVLEGDRVGWGATGRNGGFCEASITHGEENGRTRWPDEFPTLHRLAADSYAGLKATLDRHGIDCAFEETGVIAVAREEHEIGWLTDRPAAEAGAGDEAVWLDRDAMRAEVDSPTYLGGLWLKSGRALVDPARLALGLRRVAVELGARLYEHSAVTRLSDDGSAVLAEAALGHVRARRCVLATNAYPPLLRRIGAYVVPVYDYVLVTEPLGAAERAAIGWRNRQGLADCTNQFHYYRQTDDGRILWGGYDAVYHWRNGFGPGYEQRAATHELLARQFFETFPQLAGTVRFTHRWGGAIDTCSRFSVFFGTAHGGKTAYAAGYTGLGVGATRFGARVALDLADGRETEATRTAFVRTKPIPFPPEPLRYAGITLTRHELARADRNAGRRGLWLRALDRVGLGFDS
jgi:glycine/D-amino acid oxidase-like deaminating enzyme